MRALALLFLVASCMPSRPSCLPAEQAYAADVIRACVGYELDECPAVPALRAARIRAEQEIGCR